MSTRPHPPSMPLLFGYDPEIDLPSDHLARLVEEVVESIVPAGSQEAERGRPAFDLRLCIKVLVFGYSTGVRSSRQLGRLCHEHLAYLYLTRGDAPCYRTLCSVRVKYKVLLGEVWQAMFAVATAQGMVRLGRIVVDSSKFRADASRECVLTPNEYEAVAAELSRILAEAEKADQREEAEGGGPGTRLGQTVATDHMRDIIRRVRSELSQRRKVTTKPEPEADATAAGCDSPTNAPSSAIASGSDDMPLPLTNRMRQRAEAAIEAIKSAQAEGRPHLCLTDPDARMMPEGSERKIRECHSFEVAVDNGLIVVGQTTNTGSDQLRLRAIVEAAAANEPNGIIAVDADSGYYSGDVVAGLIEAKIDTCIPEGHTACDMRHKDPIGTTRTRAFGTVPFTYVEDADHYTCPEGNVLRFDKLRKKGGQIVNAYIAQRECTGCPLASACLKQPKAKRRHLYIGQNKVVLEQARKRFEQPEHQERYHNRGPAVETVFGYLRSALGYRRWSLRGSEKVDCEALLFTIAYQVRKILPAWQQRRSLAAI